VRLSFKGCGRFAARLGIILLAGFGVVVSVSAAHAQDATWNTTPGSADFNTAANWTPATVPTGTASFGTSSITSLTFSTAATALGGFTFNPGASAYTFTVGSSQSLTFNGAGIVVNGGSVDITTNGGTLFFTGSSSAIGATITANGTFDISGSTAGFVPIKTLAGSGSVQLGANGLVIANGSTEFSGTIADGGNFGGLQIVGGTQTLSGVNTYSNTTQINPGATLALKGSGSIANSADVAFAGSSAKLDISQTTAGASVAALFSFSGGVVSLGSKTLTITGGSFFGGAIQDGGIGGGSGGKLTIASGADQVLTGTSTYTGATTINGTLEVDGVIAGTSGVTVNSGGTLTGTGIVDPPTTTIMSGGIFAPGATVGPGASMTIIGNLAFQSGAIYQIYLSPTATTFATVTGTASLGGTVQAILTPGSYSHQIYDILSAAGGRGGTTFAGSVVTNYNSSLSYTATDVFLTLNGVALGNTSGLNQNQQAVANALNTFVNNGGTLPATFANLLNLSGSALGNALSQLDGEAATGAEHGAFQMMTGFLGLVLDPFVDGRFGTGSVAGGSQAIGFAPDEAQFLPPDVALAYASILGQAAAPVPFVQHWTAWGSGYGGGQFSSGNSAVGSSGLSSQIFGFAGGMDYHYSPDTIVGFALGGAGLNWGLSGGLGGGRSNSFQSGVYGITRFGPAYVAGSLAFGNHWMTTGRSALGDQLNATFDAQSYGARIEGGYRYAVLPTLGVTPYAALQPQVFHTPGYSETNTAGGGLGLTYAPMSATDLRTEIGARLDSPLLVGGTPLVLRGRLAWAHDFVSNPSLGAAFESLPGTSFVVNGAPIPNDSALVSAGAEFYLTPRWTLLAKFDGEFAGGAESYGGSGTLRYIW
jgi:autotransporter-associated beta strand protein